MRLKYLKATLFICVMILISSATINAQSMSGNKFVLGGRFGLSILDGSAGLQLGPMGQYYLVEAFISQYRKLAPNLILILREERRLNGTALSFMILNLPNQTLPLILMVE